MLGGPHTAAWYTAPQEDLLLLLRRAPSRPSDIVSLTIPCCLAMVAEVAQEQGVYNVTLQVRRTPSEQRRPAASGHGGARCRGMRHRCHLGSGSQIACMPMASIAIQMLHM